MELAEQYLSRTNRRFEVVDEDALKTNCPSCNSSACTVRRKTWIWDCESCGSRGNKYRMQQLHGTVYNIDTSADAQLSPEFVAMRKVADKFVPIWSNQLWSRPEAETAREYLMVTRRLSETVLRRANIGWSKSLPGAKRKVTTAGFGVESPDDNKWPAGWITIPIHEVDGATGDLVPTSEIDLVKCRTVPPADKSFHRLAGGKSSLYMPFQSLPFEPLLVVGGEMDVLACETAGITNSVSMTTGETGWNADVAITLESFERIVIALDNDEAGQRGAKLISERLGHHRCAIAKWPAGVKDANDCLIQLGEKQARAVMRSMIETAKPCTGEGVIRVRDIADEIVDSLKGLGRGASWGMGEDFDELTQGRRPGEVSTWIGDTGSGKSTLLSHIALEVSAMPGDSVLFIPLELGAKRQAMKWLRQYTGKSPKSLDEDTVRETLAAISGRRLYLLNHYGAIDPDTLKSTLEYAKLKLGVTLIVVDHLHFAVRTGDKERERLERMMDVLAESAVKLDTHVCLVAHPHGTGNKDDKNRDNRVIQMGDIKGSSAIKQVSDNVFSIFRKRNEKRQGVLDDNGFGHTIIYALKVRDDDAQEGAVALRFRPESATFSEDVAVPDEPAKDDHWTNRIERD